VARFLQYNGPADTRELTAADLKKAGVEGAHKVTYLKGVPAEVKDDATADALLQHDLFAGEFSEVDDPGQVEAAPEPMTEKSLVGKGASSGGADAAGGGGGRGGNGAST
jgi:hypothetical protein